MPIAIAVRARAKSRPELGLIAPLVIENDEFVEKAEETKFPNNGLIFVVSDFERLQDDGLFRISYALNHEYDSSKEDNCRFIAFGDDARQLERPQYPHVVDGELNLDSRVLTLKYKPERLIVLRSQDGNFFGPFDYDNSSRQMEDGSYQVELKPYAGLPRCSNKFNAYDNFVLRFLPSSSLSVLEYNSPSGVQEFLIGDVNAICQQKADVVDYIPDAQLIKIGNSLLNGSSSLTKAQISSFRAAIAGLPDTENFDKQRRDRLVKIANRLDVWETQSASLVSEFLDTPEGVAQVNTYLHSHKSELLGMAESVYAEDLEKLRQESDKSSNETRKALDESVNALRQQKRELQQQIDQAETKLQQTQDQFDEKQRESSTVALKAVENQLQEKHSEIEAIQIEIEELLKTVPLLKNVQSLDKINSYYEVDNQKKKSEGDKLVASIEELRKTENEIRQGIKKEHQDLKRKLAEVARDDKPYLDILNGIIPAFEDEQPKEIKPIKLRDPAPANLTELVEELQRTLSEDFGRKYRFDEIANYLICIHQNFLTVFWGLPGVGKTSLVTSLAGALGLESQDCFLFMPTARGLTSSRDVLGYYNPLSQRFQPAPTGLYDALIRGIQQKDYPHWVLLDEANLSPLEHYFSSFLSMCDPGYPRNVVTGIPGGDADLKVPDSFRFLATINYDNTTEPLSARVIDRVPVIYLDPPKEIENDSLTRPMRQLLTYSDFSRIMTPEGEADDGQDFPDEMRVLKSVFQALEASEADKGMPTIVSARKRVKIQQYLSVARGPMTRKVNYPLLALDYAVAQHILPLINGNGEKYRRRLKSLEESVSQLDKSRTILRRIIETGEEQYEFYRYFC